MLFRGFDACLRSGSPLFFNSGNENDRSVTAATFRGSRVLAATLALELFAVSVLVLRADPAQEFAKEIRPLLEKNCYECHGTNKMKGGLNLASFKDYTNVVAAAETFDTVRERILAYEMPPKPRGLDFDVHEKLADWLGQLPQAEHADCDKIASDRNSGNYRGYVMSRRLNRYEYNNTVRDLIGTDLRLDQALPADGGGGEGFDTSGNALFISSIHIEKYLQAADKALDVVFPAKGYSNSIAVKLARQRVLVSRPSLFTPARTAARAVVSNFARQAFRRPVEDEEVERLLTLFDRVYRRGDSYDSALRQPLKAILVSPDFLFLAEPETGHGGVQQLAPYPLVTRLSYFIWSSMPDDELFRLAETRQIMDTNVLARQVTRMLADPRAKALGERFTLQWLALDRLGTEVQPDHAKFPEFDSSLAQAMRDEAVAVFNYILHDNRSLLELIDSDYTFVNGRLAQLYGISNEAGEEFRQVRLSDKNRGGILGMAGIATLTSFPTRTSPVLRGKWVMESLLGEKVNPPPPDVPPLQETQAKLAHASLREQLQAHRAKPECAACHDKMDPLGFGLENFDVLGRWREQDNGLPIDSHGKLPNGQTYEGPAGLKLILLGRKEQIMRYLTRKMIGFAYGRELNKFDQCVVDKTMEVLKANNYQSDLLIQQIAASYPFQHRFYPKQDVAYDHN